MRTMVLILAAAAAAFCQDIPDGLTVSVSRPLNAQPDQVNILVYVTSDTSSAIDDVLAVLKGTKITADNLSSVGTLNYHTPQLQWAFNQTVSLTDLGSTVAALAAAQTKAESEVSFYVENASISPQLQAQQPCPYGALVSDARTAAQQIAGAAGVTLGPIAAMTDGYGAATATPAYAVLAPLTGNFSIGPYTGVIAGGLIGSLSYFLSPPTPPPSCTLTVQFKLGK